MNENWTPEQKMLYRAMSLLWDNNMEWKALAESYALGNWKAEDQETWKQTDALVKEIHEYFKDK